MPLRLSDSKISNVQQWLPESLRLGSTNWDNLILSLIVLAGLGLLRWAARWIILRRTDDVRLRYRASKLATYTATTLGIFLLGSIWFSGRPLNANDFGSSSDGRSSDAKTGRPGNISMVNSDIPPVTG